MYGMKERPSCVAGDTVHPTTGTFPGYVINTSIYGSNKYKTLHVVYMKSYTWYAVIVSVTAFIITHRYLS